MKVVVNDANILIDLVELRLLPHFFELEYAFHTTDLILEELREDQQKAIMPYVDVERLQVNEMTDDDLIAVYEIKAQCPGLSEQDCSAFYRAQSLQGILLTSDNTLRKFAKSQQVEVHGHLWIFDRMVETEAISPAHAIEKLDELCETVNPHLGLPVAECEKRKLSWRQ